MPTILERLIPGALATNVRVAELTEQLGQERNNGELLTESITQLQLAMEDIGWHRLIAQGEQEFTRGGLRQITAACRLFLLSNPLIKRGIYLRSSYVHGQGVEVTARANGKRERVNEQDVNTVLQEFRDDPDNRRNFTGTDARLRMERSLGTDGNLFFSLWTKPLSGRVQVRLLPWDEIVDIITNPDDASEPWFYHRQWTEPATLDPTTGMTKQGVLREAFYPAIGHRPRVRPKSFGPWEVRWDAPVRPLKVNELDGWKFGVGDAYAGISWARAYKEFLEDWAKLVKALSRFAWRTTAKGAGQAAAIKAKVAAPPGRNAVTGEPNNVGQTVVIGEGQLLEAIPKSGATIDAGSGRPLAMMVASALGVPVTMLLADPGTTGARAVAKTLDPPLELEMEARRSLWADLERDICEFVIRESVRAPQGLLKGVLGRDEYGRETVTLAGDTEKTIDVVWPDVKDLDPAVIVAAIAQAAATGVVPPETILRLLLGALGVKAPDEIVDELVDDQGVFHWPDAPPLSPGAAASAAALAGADPADTGDGPMAPDPQAGDGGGNT